MQGPEIRTGFLEDPDTPLKFTAGDEIMITTDYEYKGNQKMIAMRWDPGHSMHHEAAVMEPPVRPWHTSASAAP